MPVHGESPERTSGVDWHIGAVIHQLSQRRPETQMPMTGVPILASQRLALLDPPLGTLNWVG